MLERFLEHLRSRPWFDPEETILVGYSGGPDSTCLIHLLHLAGVSIVAAHLHHCQREEAALEAKLCEAFCSELGIPFVTGRADVPTMSAQMRMSVEEAGRHARYEFFRQAAFRLQCPKVATAHTRDDHVETVLLNLARGTGLSGLAGIPEVRDGIVRPLLPYARAETRLYCEEHGLWTHDDPANSDVNFSRARVRHRVLPELRCINPDLDGAISRLSSIAAEEDRYLDSHAVHSLGDSEIALNGHLRFLTLPVEAAFSKARLRELPRVPLRRAIRLVASAIGAEMTFNHLQKIADGLKSPAGSVTSEGGAVVIEWDAEQVHFRQTTSQEPFRFPLTIPGATDSDPFGWTLEALNVEGPSTPFERNSLDIVLDSAKLKGPLFLRSAEAGDRVAPMGFEHQRKLSDLLGEAKLTQAAKKRLPIICDILGIVWVPGVCLADRVKVDDKTSRGMRLRFGPLATGSFASS